MAMPVSCCAGRFVRDALILAEACSSQERAGTRVRIYAACVSPFNCSDW
jgi:hypothetical protein